MVRDLNFVCALMFYSMRWSGAGLWADLYAFRPLSEMGSFLIKVTSAAAMASIPLTATGIVITQTSVVYVVCSLVCPPLMCRLGPAPGRTRRRGNVVIYEEVLDRQPA
jgi:hypothetical protein